MPYLLLLVAPILMMLIPFFWKRLSRFLAVSAIFTIIMIGSLFQWSNNTLFIYLFFPQRSFPVTVSILYAFLCCSTYLLITKLRIKIEAKGQEHHMNWMPKILSVRHNHRFPSSRTLKNVLSKGLTILICLLLSLSVTYFYSWYNAFAVPNWNINSGGGGDDFAALEWINLNVPKTDLVVNDRTLSGLMLPAFSARKVVYFFTIGRSSFEAGTRMHDCEMIYEDPTNYSMIREVFLRWNVRYVFLSSDGTYFKYTYTYYGNGTYTYTWNGGDYASRKWTNRQIINAFDSNPYLERVFEKGDSRVYKINVARLSTLINHGTTASEGIATGNDRVGKFYP